MNTKIARLLCGVGVVITMPGFLIPVVGRAQQTSSTEQSLFQKIPDYLKDDLVLYYCFDQGGGEKVNDLSGNGNHGQLQGVRCRSEGKVGAGGFFDGVDDYVRVENVDLEAFTFAAWVKTSTSRINNRRVFLFDSGDDSFFAVQGATGGDVEFNTVIWTEDENEWEDEGVETGDRIVEENTWTHIVATFDGTKAGIYFNGRLIQTREFTRKGFTGTLYIGGIQAHNGELWEGAIDEVAIFNRALFAAEVKFLYHPDGENPLVELKAYCESGGKQSRKMLDILQRVTKAMQEQGEADAEPQSARGIARFYEIRKESADKINWEKEEEERIIQFQFKGNSSRSDIFSGRAGKPRQLESIFAESPEYGIRYYGDDVHIEDNEIGIFHRELGYDMHPETFSTFRGLAPAEFLSRYTKWAEKVGGQLSMTLTDQGALKFELEYTGEEPGERATLTARIDLTPPARFLSFVESSENYEGAGSKTYIQYHVHWQWHGARCYIRQAEFTKEEAEFDDEDHPDQLCHRYWHQKVEVLAYDAKAAIPDRAFTLPGLALKSDTDIRDRVRKAEYSLEDVLSGRIQPGLWFKSLVGKRLPEPSAFGDNWIDVAIQSRMLLACFFDMNQRPSRRCILQLAKQAKQLREKDVTIVAIQASKVSGKALADWIEQNDVPFPVGAIEADVAKTRFAWGVRSLPWLILTDRERVVRAEGFPLSELDENIKEISRR